MRCYVRGEKNSMGCYVRGDKNSMGCFVQGGKSLWDVMSGVTKTAWDVLSRNVLSGSHAYPAKYFRILRGMQAYLKPWLAV